MTQPPGYAPRIEADQLQQPVSALEDYLPSGRTPFGAGPLAERPRWPRKAGPALSDEAWALQLKVEANRHEKWLESLKRRGEAIDARQAGFLEPILHGSTHVRNAAIGQLVKDVPDNQERMLFVRRVQEEAEADAAAFAAREQEAGVAGKVGLHGLRMSEEGIRGLNRMADAAGRVTFAPKPGSDEFVTGYSEEDRRFVNAITRAKGQGFPTATEEMGLFRRGTVAAPGMVPDMAASVAALRAGGPKAMVGYWSARLYPETVDELREMGVPKTQAQITGAVVASAVAALEALNPDPTGVSSRAGLAAVRQNFKQRLLQVGKNWAWEAAEEGPQGFVDEAGKILSSWAYEHIPDRDAADAFTRLWRDTYEAVVPIGLTMAPGSVLKVSGLVEPGENPFLKDLTDSEHAAEMLRVHQLGTAPSRSQTKRWGASLKQREFAETRQEFLEERVERIWAEIRNALQRMGTGYDEAADLQGQAMAAELAPSDGIPLQEEAAPSPTVRPSPLGSRVAATRGAIQGREPTSAPKMEAVPLVDLPSERRTLSEEEVRPETPIDQVAVSEVAEGLPEDATQQGGEPQPVAPSARTMAKLLRRPALESLARRHGFAPKLKSDRFLRTMAVGWLEDEGLSPDVGRGARRAPEPYLGDRPLSQFSESDVRLLGDMLKLPDAETSDIGSLTEKILESDSGAVDRAIAGWRAFMEREGPDAPNVQRVEPEVNPPSVESVPNLGTITPMEEPRPPMVREVAKAGPRVEAAADAMAWINSLIEAEAQGAPKVAGAATPAEVESTSKFDIEDLQEPTKVVPSFVARTGPGLSPREQSGYKLQSRLRGLEMMGHAEIDAHEDGSVSLAFVSGGKVRVRFGTEEEMSEIDTRYRSGREESARVATSLGETVDLTKPSPGYLLGDSLVLREDIQHEELSHEIVEAFAKMGLVTEKEIARFGGTEELAVRYQQHVRLKMEGKPALSYGARDVLRRIYDFWGALLNSLNPRARGRKRTLRAIERGTVADRTPTAKKNKGAPSEPTFSIRRARAEDYAGGAGHSPTSTLTSTQVRALGRGVPIRERVRAAFENRGLLPRRAYEATQDMTSEIEARREYAHQQLSDTRKAVRQTTISSARLARALTDKATRDALPDAPRRAVEAERLLIDMNTLELITLNAFSNPALAGIVDNIGAYLNTSYRVFTEKKYRPSEVDSKDMYELLKQQLPDASEDKLWAELDLLARVGQQYSSTIEFLSDPSAFSIPDGILKTKKGVHPTLARFWGIEKDHDKLFFRTVMLQTKLITKLRLLERLEAEGAGQWFFKERTGRFNQEIPSTGIERIDKLGGLFTTPEIKAGLGGFFHPKKPNQFIATLRGLNTLGKVNKTVLSFPGTHLRNEMTNELLSVMDGNYFQRGGLRAILASLEMMFEAGDVSIRQDGLYSSLLGFIEDVSGLSGFDVRGFLVEGKKYGVLGQSVRIAEVTQTISEIMGLASRQEISDPELRGWLATLWRGAAKSYTIGDEMPKLRSWLYFQDEYGKAWPNASEEQIKQKAAEIVKNTYPTMDRAVPIAQALRKNVLLGLFSIFPSEIIRNTYWRLRYMQEELDDPATRSIGVKRAIGMVGMAAVPVYTLSTISATMGEVDSDDDKDLRLFDAAYDRGNTRAYLKRDRKKNEFTNFNYDYTNPWAVFSQPLNIALTGENWVDSFNGVVHEFARTFLAPELGAKSVVDAASTAVKVILGYDLIKGAPVSPEGSSAATQVLESAGRIGENYDLGTRKYLENVYKGATGQTNDYSKAYKLAPEISGAFGIRFTVVNLPTALRFRASALRASATVSLDDFRGRMRTAGEVSDSTIRRQLLRGLKRRDKMLAEVIKLIEAQERLEVPKGVIRTAIDDAGFSEEDTAQLVYRKTIPRYSLPDTVGVGHYDRRRLAKEVISDYYKKEH